VSAPRARRGPLLRSRRLPADGALRAQRSQRARAAVPNFFTLMNLLAGFFSLLYAADGHLEAAAWLVVLAGFFDLLDGMLARLAGVSSEFGLELDSLSDVVSFGVAPSFLLYEFGLHQLGPLWGALLASLPALFGALRLAYFNTQASPEKKSAEFRGLPIPAQAGTVVVFILTFGPASGLGESVLARPQISALIILVVVLSTLMVSPVPFPALPQPSRANLRTYRWRFVSFLVALVLAGIFQERGLLFVAVVYLATGVGRALAWAYRAATTDPADAEPALALEDPPPRMGEV
jgi:CDP-diacylglycerol--serine O-phosphatidyltransferase